jgi:hypothetical protein
MRENEKEKERVREKRNREIEKMRGLVRKENERTIDVCRL